MPVVNFASETIFESNTTSGNVSLTRAQLQTLVDGNYTSGGVVLSGSDILALDVDLGERIGISDIRYYFTGASASGTVVSGINFYYKDYESDPWVSLTTAIGAGYYTTTSGNFFPRLVRVVHTISGTAVSGTLHEYEVNSNEDIVDYGTDGTLIEKDLQDTPFGTSDPYTIPVYNDGDRTATAYVYIGNTGTDADDMLRISEAQNGTYVGIDDGVVIGSDDGEFPFTFGNLDGTAVVTNLLKLDAPSGGYIGETALADPYRAVTVPGNSLDEAVIYYGLDLSFRRKNLDTGLDEPLSSPGANINYFSKLIYAPDFNRIYLVYRNGSAQFGLRYFDIDTDTWSGHVSTWNHGQPEQFHSWIPGCAYVPPGKWAGDSNELASITVWGLCTDSDDVQAYSPFGRFTISGTGDPGDYYNETVHTPSSYGAFYQSDVSSNAPQRSMACAYYYPDGGNEGQIYYIMAPYAYAYYINIFDVDSVTWSNITISATVKALNMDSVKLHSRNWHDIFVYNDIIYMGQCSDTTSEDYIYYLDMTTNTWSRVYWFDNAFDADNERIHFEGVDYGSGNAILFYVGGENEDIRTSPWPSTGSTAYFKEGTYTTPILKNIDPTYWYIDEEIPENTSITTSTGTVASTIEIRSSDTTPTAEASHYNVIFTRGGSSDNYIYPTGYDYDGNQLWQDTSLGAGTNWYYISYVQGWATAVNHHYPLGDTSYDVNSIFIWNVRYSGGNASRIYVHIFDRDGGLTYSRLLVSEAYDSDYRRPTNALINANGNTYVLWRGFGAFDDRISLLTDTGWWVNNVDFSGDQSTLYSMCLAGEAKEDVWFIKEDENIVYRYSPNLTEVTSVTNTNFVNLNGICEDEDGGFFVGNYGSGSTWVHHYDKDGTLIATHDVTAHVQVVHRLRKDYYGGFWLIDTWSDQVARFSRTGGFIGKVALSTPRGMDSSPLGCHVMSQTTDNLDFIDIDVNLEKTVSFPKDIYHTSDGSNWRGGSAASVDASGYLPADDVGSDSHWGPGGDLEWSEVGKDSHFLHHKKYHQARITLRGDGTDTPEVEKIALPPTVELANIPPQGSRSAYLKTVVASGTQRNVQQGKIRTWFDMEE